MPVGTGDGGWLRTGAALRRRSRRPPSTRFLSSSFQTEARAVCQEDASRSVSRVGEDMKISHLTPLNRRDAMRLLLTGTGATGIAALTQHVPWAAGETQQAAAPRSASGVIWYRQCYLKDVPPEALGNGAVLLHDEHLSLGGPKPPRRSPGLSNWSRRRAGTA